MGHDAWLAVDGAELINLSRTAQLAEALGIDTVWTEPSTVQWIEDALSGEDYDLITEAPWYDPGYPASAEFAGFVPLAIQGLDDSTLEATTVEYITNGGAAGRSRNKTRPIVANVALVASTERGADYGKRWLDRMLRGAGARTFCSGSELRYFRWEQRDGQTVPPQAHLRDVTLSRGTSVTRKRSTPCSATWLVTFTWTANDPFEYGDEVAQFTGLGGTVSGAGVLSSGVQSMIEQACPAYDYTPIYDPLHPALVAPPVVPDFYPAGWALLPGAAFDRHWVRLSSLEPSVMGAVPALTLRASSEARMVRVSVWPSSSNPDDFCDPLWQAVVTYLPPGLDFVLDGEQEAAYAWDGYSPSVRRTDSLVYGQDARPMDWTAVSDPGGLLVTLDVMDGAGYDGGGSVRASLSLVPKSD